MDQVEAALLASTIGEGGERVTFGFAVRGRDPSGAVVWVMNGRNADRVALSRMAAAMYFDAGDAETWRDRAQRQADAESVPLRFEVVPFGEAS